MWACSHFRAPPAAFFPEGRTLNSVLWFYLDILPINPGTVLSPLGRWIWMSQTWGWALAVETVASSHLSSVGLNTEPHKHLCLFYPSKEAWLLSDHSRCILHRSFLWTKETDSKLALKWRLPTSISTCTYFLCVTVLGDSPTRPQNFSWYFHIDGRVVH